MITELHAAAAPQNLNLKSSLHNFPSKKSTLGNQQPEDEGKCNLEIDLVHFLCHAEIVYPKKNFVQESFFRSLV